MILCEIRHVSRKQDQEILHITVHSHRVCAHKWRKLDGLSMMGGVGEGNTFSYVLLCNQISQIPKVMALTSFHLYS